MHTYELIRSLLAAVTSVSLLAATHGLICSLEHLETARHLFEGVGRALVVDEKHMDAITALSASGPAFALKFGIAFWSRAVSHPKLIRNPRAGLLLVITMMS